jgi:phosphatidate cytidylyltransferase
MPRDDEDTERGLDDDPFKDLDQFFKRGGDRTFRKRDRAAVGEEPAGTRADDDDLLPADWKPPVEGLDETSDFDASVQVGEPPDLTVDALKKPPAEYADLPGAEEEPPIRAGAGRDETPPPSLPPEESDDPDLAEVEAAADQMAEELRVPAEDDLLADLLTPTDEAAPTRDRFAGPSWEEPTGGQALMAETVAPPAGRNIPMALLTAAVLAAAGLISLAISTAVFAVIVGAIALFGQLELYAVMQRRGLQPATALGLVVGALLLAAAYLRGESAMVFFVVLGLALSALWYMAAAPKARDGALGNIAATMLGIVYVPLLASYVLLTVTEPSGRALTLSVLGLTFGYDAVAFFVGSVWGTRPLAPTISPKKSWQGLLAATITTFALSAAILPSIESVFTLSTSVGLALVIAVFAPLGDLTESFMKRDLGVKDMGSILPGHGGVLDRIDSVLLVAPAAFYFLRLIS